MGTEEEFLQGVNRYNRVINAGLLYKALADARPRWYDKYTPFNGSDSVFVGRDKHGRLWLQAKDTNSIRVCIRNILIKIKRFINGVMK